MTKKKLSDKLQVWVDARRKRHLSHAHVQMARELGLNPKKLSKIDNHHQESWKAPLPEFIEELYEKRFGKRRPDVVLSIEDLARRQQVKKDATIEAKAARRPVNRQDRSQAGDRPEPAHVLRARPVRERHRSDHLIAPVADYLEGRSLSDPGLLEEVIYEFIADVEYGYFQIWEAIELKENGEPLSRKQQERLDDLVRVGGDDYDGGFCEECCDYDDGSHPIRTVNERARPDRPWYEIFRELAAHLLKEPIRTFHIHYETTTTGWVDILNCLNEHGRDLFLPEGAGSPEEVIPPDLRHKLWLQWCADPLIGLGQEDVNALEEDEYRIREFVDTLRKCKESVEHLALTLDTLTQRIVLPESDRAHLVARLRWILSLDSTRQGIADRL